MSVHNLALVQDPRLLSAFDEAVATRVHALIDPLTGEEKPDTDTNRAITVTGFMALRLAGAAQEMHLLGNYQLEAALLSCQHFMTYSVNNLTDEDGASWTFEDARRCYDVAHETLAAVDAAYPELELMGQD